MARKVYISSSMSTDEEISEIAEVDQMAALMWPWLLTYFDDWGRAKASPREIKNSVFQANELITIDVIKQALQLYQDKLIHLYSVGGKWYMAIPQEKWFKFQTHIRSHKRDNDGSKIPPPPDGDNSAHLRASARSDEEVSADARDYSPSPSPSLSLSPSPSKDSSSRSSRENPFGLFETHKFGVLDDITRDLIGDSIDDYSEGWVIRAIKESVLQNVHTWSYVNKILKRWKETNHLEPWTLDKPVETKPSGNVHNFPAQRGNGKYKQQIPVAKQTTGRTLSPEERERIRQTARELDETFGNKGRETS